MASIYEREGTIEAIEKFREAIALDPGFADAWAGLSLALVGTTITGTSAGTTSAEALAEANEAAQMAVKLNPESWYANYAVGGYFGSGMVGGYADANPYFEKALALNPNDGDLLVIHGSNLSSQGRSAEAFAAWERSYARNPLSAVSLLARAGVAYGRDRDKAATRDYVERALRLAPGRLFVRWWAGELYDGLGDRDEALRQFLFVAQENERDVRSRLSISNRFRFLGDHETASYWLDQAEAFAPTNSQVLMHRTWNLLARREFGLHHEHVAKWAEREPENRTAASFAIGRNWGTVVDTLAREDAQIWRGLIQEQLTGTLAWLKEFGDDRPVNPWNSWWFLRAGLDAKRLDDPELSAELLNKAIAFQHEEANPAREQMLICHAALGDHDRAIELLAELVADGYTSLFWIDYTGMLRDEFGIFGNIMSNVRFSRLIDQMRTSNEATLAALRKSQPDLFPRVSDTAL